MLLWSLACLSMVRAVYRSLHLFVLFPKQT